MLDLTTCSEAETFSAGELLGLLLEPGDVVTLSGELGAGKTRFSQGIAAGIGVDPSYPVTSPTFTILNEYTGRCPLFHFDFYRFTGGNDLRDLGFEEYFAGHGACLVEWPERLESGSFDEFIEVLFTVTDETTRGITLIPHGDVPLQRLAALANCAKNLLTHAVFPAKKPHAHKAVL